MSVDTVDMSERSRTLSLPGVEPDNLLAFLALLGLLRLLDHARPQWMARVRWEGRPLRAHLTLASEVSRAEVVAACEAALILFAPTYAFGRKDLAFSKEDYRDLQILARGDRLQSSLISALASDGAVKSGSKPAQVVATPLCAIFGQGHQHFLARLAARAGEHGADVRRYLAEALWARWRYEDRTEGFRWDPTEDRRYAHQFGNPSEARNKVGTVAGANVLAAVGVGLYTSAPGPGGEKLLTVGVVNSRRQTEVCWPICSGPASALAHQSLLGHPALTCHSRTTELAAYGVVAVAASKRYQVEKYFNFERATLRFTGALE